MKKGINLLESYKYKAYNVHGKTMQTCIIKACPSLNWREYRGKGLHNKVKFLTKLPSEEFDKLGKGMELYEIARVQLAMCFAIREAGLHPIMHRLGIITPLLADTFEDLKMSNNDIAATFKASYKQYLSDSKAVYIAYCMRNNYRIEYAEFQDIPWVIKYNKRSNGRDPEYVEMDEYLNTIRISCEEFNRLRDIESKYNELVTE